MLICDVEASKSYSIFFKWNQEMRKILAIYYRKYFKELCTCNFLSLFVI